MLGFIYGLQEAGVPVSVKYILELYRALRRGLAPDVDRLFLLARLIFVKRVEHYDAFEQVFAFYFLGEAGGHAREVLNWEELMAAKPFHEWLQQQIEAGLLPPDAMRSFDIEELLSRFWETMLAQDGEHHGGNRWVGTRGRSPYGHNGRSGGGVRVHGQGVHGTAQKVIGQRNYLNYRGNSPLTAENLRQALTSLKSLRPMGPESELDIDETIARTAKNGGEIELVFRRELRNRPKLAVLIDNGGYSMSPYFLLVKTVFNRIEDCFKDVKFYYFHNCIYGTVYKDPERTRFVKWDAFINQGKNMRLILIGDANMAPSELMASFGSIDIYSNERRPGVEWLKDLRKSFPASVWLNPIQKERWAEESSTIQAIGRIFHMEDLTLNGIKNAVAYLNDQGREYDLYPGAAAGSL